MFSTNREQQTCQLIQLQIDAKEQYPIHNHSKTRKGVEKKPLMVMVMVTVMVMVMVMAMVMLLKGKDDGRSNHAGF